MQADEERRRIGREIKKYLAVNRISREQFCFETKLGKSTVDKLITGIYSDATLQIVLERTNFVRGNTSAAKPLGEYTRAAWSGYLADFLFLHPSISDDAALQALRVTINWDDNLPGLVLLPKSIKATKLTPIGALHIPHSRSPLIYIQPIDSVGRYLVVSTMTGEAVMRGIMLTVHNPMANAWVPVAVPVTLRRLEENEPISSGDLGRIDAEHPKFCEYQSELKKTVEKQYGRLISASNPIATRRRKKI